MVRRLSLDRQQQACSHPHSWNLSAPTCPFQRCRSPPRRAASCHSCPITKPRVCQRVLTIFRRKNEAKEDRKQRGWSRGLARERSGKVACLQLSNPKPCCREKRRRVSETSFRCSSFGFWRSLSKPKQSHYLSSTGAAGAAGSKT